MVRLKRMMMPHLTIRAALVWSVALTLVGCASGDLAPAPGDDPPDAPPTRPDMPLDARPDVPVTPPADVPPDGPDVPPTDTPADLDTPNDVMPDVPPPGPCGGDTCTEREVCREARCVDLCVMQSAQCGEVIQGGASVMCGGCQAPQVCLLNRCENTCQEAAIACGPIDWDGGRAECGPCAQGECVASQCIVPSGGYRRIAAGHQHTCATRGDRQVRCWGRNVEGQLGNNRATNDSTSPVNVTSLMGALYPSAAPFTSCAVDDQDRAWCWGDNDFWQLANGVQVDGPAPFRNGLLTNVQQITGGLQHTCALQHTGQVSCWGSNGYGQLGTSDPPSTTRPQPEPLFGMPDAIQIDAGTLHTCAVRRNHTAWCWGYNGSTNAPGRLGTGDATFKRSPTQVLALNARIRQVAAGDAHTCAVTQEGQVYCWGDGSRGQLGRGSTASSLTPALVPTLTNIVAIDAGGAHTCAINNTRRMWCWGANDFGQVGTGNADGVDEPRPFFNTALVDVLEVSLGDHHSCAITMTGEAFCWGRNDAGQIGDGTINTRRAPVRVP